MDALGIPAPARRPYPFQWFHAAGIWLVALRTLGLRAFRADVAVLWGTPDGRGLDNVTLGALAFAPRGILAVLPDGATRRVSFAAVPALLYRRLSDAAERAAAPGWAWLRSIEGPEQEPRPWHSHALSYRAQDRDTPPFAQQLRGVTLDIGAGAGLMARYLDSARTRYLPTDLPTGRDAGDANITRSGRRPAVHCDGCALPFKDDSLDNVLCAQVLEHVTHPQQILTEARRVLRPGGHALITVPFAFPVHGAPWDYRRWTPEGLRQELVQAGFEVLESGPLGNSLETLATLVILWLKYRVAGRARGLSRLALVAVWPIVLAGQALLNVTVPARAPEGSTMLPLGVAVLARKPDTASK